MLLLPRLQQGIYVANESEFNLEALNGSFAESRLGERLLVELVVNRRHLGVVRKQVLDLVLFPGELSLLLLGRLPLATDVSEYNHIQL